MVVIGVTGYMGSGKDTVAEHLMKEQGFIHISLSDILREDLTRVGKELSRENLQQLGNELRTRLGGHILAERAMGRMEKDKNYVITSIGRVDEVQAFKKFKEFKLIFVDAPDKLRYERQLNRGRFEDKTLTFEEFQKNEERERTGGGAQFREFDNLKNSADITINNDSTLEEFHKQIESVAAQINKRPGWDDYFFGIMEAVAKRATCDRGKSGALVVRDNVILATGYVGSPKGLPQCDEVGHLFEKKIHATGEESTHCVRTIHAEQNAIIQAANNGVALRGAKMYCKMEPCSVCANMIINSGITEVVAQRRYHAAQRTRELFKQAGIILRVKEDALETYKNQ